MGRANNSPWESQAGRRRPRGPRRDRRSPPPPDPHAGWVGPPRAQDERWWWWMRGGDEDVGEMGGGVGSGEERDVMFSPWGWRVWYVCGMLSMGSSVL